MPNTDIISDVIASEAFTEVVKFQKAIAELEKSFVSTAQAADIMNAAVSGSKGIKELQDNTKKLNEENGRLINLEKQIADAAAKRAVAESNLGKMLAEEKILLQQTNKENANRAKIRLTETGSLARWKAQMESVMASQRGLNLETEKGREQNIKHIKVIDALNQKIKENSDAASKQRLNIGNYQGSAKLIVDALEKEKKKLEELMAVRSKMQNVQNAGSPPLSPAASSGANISRTTISGFAGGNTSAELSKINAQIENSRKIVEGFSRVTENPKFLNIAGKVGDANAELKGMTKQLIELERAGLGNTQGAIDLRNALAKLTDEVADAKEEIKALSSDSRAFDLFAGSVSFAADAMQTFAGAAVLAGASEEDAAEATKNLVAIQSVANGVKGIANELTTRGTAANKVYAFTQGLVATAFDKSATASKRFVAALGVIGIILTVVGAVVLALGQLNKKLSESEQRQKALNDVVKEGAADFGKAKVEVAAMTNEIALAKKGLLDKETVLKKFNETIGETIGQTNDLGEAEKLLNDKKDAYIEMMFAKSQAVAAFALAQKAAEESVKNEAATTDDLLSTWDKIKSFSMGAQFSGIAQIVTAEENRVDNRAELQSKYNAFIDLGNKKLEESAVISQQNNFTSKEQLEIEKQKAEAAKKTAEEAAKARKKAADDAKKMQDDLNKLNLKISGDELKAKQAADSLKLKQAGDVFKAIADDEKKSLQERLIANGFYYGTLEKEIANKQQFEKDALVSSLILEKEQILKRKLNQSEIAATYQQVNNQLTVIEQKAQDEIAAIHSQGIENQKNIIENSTAQRLESLSKRSAIEINGINKAESEALTALEYQYNQKLISEEDYEKEKAKIAAKYEGERLQAELNTAIELLEIAKATGADVTDAEAKIAAIRLKIAQNLTEGLKVENKKQGLSDKELAEKKKELWKQLGQELKETVFSFVDAGFERQKNTLEKEKILVDERRDTELKRINALQISEEAKADKIKILDANVQAQKEVIARRQKQLDIQKAKADKVKAIFDIGVNTATAIVKTIRELGMPFAVPFIALVSAIGALQLARVIATPIPQYYTGTEDSGQAGLAIVGDRYGKELIKLQDGSMYETPNKATMVNLPAHSEVISNADYRKIMNSEYFYNSNKGHQPFNDRQFFEWQMKIADSNTERVVEAIKNKPELNVNISPHGIDVYKKHEYSHIDYVNKKARFRP